MGCRHLPTFHNGAFNDSRVSLLFQDGLKVINALPDGR
jgi:spermidine synthase